MPIYVWIVLAIVLALGAFLLLPVRFIIRNDDENHLFFRVKFLFWTFGEPSEKTKPKGGTRGKLGIDALEKESLKAKVQENGILETVKIGAKIIKQIFNELIGVLRHCKVQKFYFKLLCSDQDASDAAIKYGGCCAIVYPLLGYINSIINVNPKNRNIDITCKYEAVSEEFRYDFLISVRIVYLFLASIHLLYKYIKHKATQKRSK